MHQKRTRIVLLFEIDYYNNFPWRDLKEFWYWITSEVCVEIIFFQLTESKNERILENLENMFYIKDKLRYLARIQRIS